MRRSSSIGFAMLEAVFEKPSLARLAYSSTKPDESVEARGLRAFSRLNGDRIVFKVACRRGVASLAYTLYEYLQHLMLIEEAASLLEEATCP